LTWDNPNRRIASDLDRERSHFEKLVDVLLRNLPGPVDLIRVHVVAQITPELGQKSLPGRSIFRTLFWKWKNPVEIEAADEKVAGKTAALIQRIARTLRQSRAAALPADIFDVSITGAVAGFAVVSSAICFSGASSGDFIFSVRSANVLRSRERTVSAQRESRFTDLGKM
jgi:hypothetical protein